jgi:hypothetical protein
MDVILAELPNARTRIVGLHDELEAEGDPEV